MESVKIPRRQVKKPYIKKEKKTKAKNKLKVIIVIPPLSMNNHDFMDKDNVPDTPMHDNYGGELPRFVVKPKEKSASIQMPLQELNTLVESIKPDPSTEKTWVDAVEEGEIVPGIEGTGTYHYSSLEELSDSVEVSYPFPIHQTAMEELKSKKETCNDVFLRCSTARCPVFCNLRNYNHYYYQCQRQGHPWFTLNKIDKMCTYSCSEIDSLGLQTNVPKMPVGRNEIDQEIA
ncbi:hypothetical protein AWC38_SpisGene12220 [Stylophora pistillata]|uniref:Uncharacterized protein n=1 Tax=Stylophora pistillata TaxID=50429 RepID=A0A2B4RXN7_STYPI|nr:hypothetical protein AWC38_SpisGene12220 [Stylophora pistillata]